MSGRRAAGAVEPELVAIVVGLVMLSVGLCVWLGWPVALVIVGGLLVVMGVWSAAMGERAAKGSGGAGD